MCRTFAANADIGHDSRGGVLLPTLRVWMGRLSVLGPFFSVLDTCLSVSNVRSQWRCRERQQRRSAGPCVECARHVISLCWTLLSVCRTLIFAFLDPCYSVLDTYSRSVDPSQLCWTLSTSVQLCWTHFTHRHVALWKALYYTLEGSTD